MLPSGHITLIMAPKDLYKHIHYLNFLEQSRKNMSLTECRNNALQSFLVQKKGWWSKVKRSDFNGEEPSYKGIWEESGMTKWWSLMAIYTTCHFSAISLLQRNWQMSGGFGMSNAMARNWTSASFDLSGLSPWTLHLHLMRQVFMCVFLPCLFQRESICYEGTCSSHCEHPHLYQPCTQ